MLRGEGTGVSRGFSGTAASRVFCAAQNAPKSAGTGWLGLICVGSIPTPPSAVSFVSPTCPFTRHCKKPGVSSVPVTVARPSTSFACPLRFGSTPSCVSVHCTSPSAAGFPSTSSFTVKVTISPRRYSASARSATTVSVCAGFTATAASAAEPTATSQPRATTCPIMRRRNRNDLMIQNLNASTRSRRHHFQPSPAPLLNGSLPAISAPAARPSRPQKKSFFVLVIVLLLHRLKIAPRHRLSVYPVYSVGHSSALDRTRSSFS